MGTIAYDGWTVDFEDRLLAHIHVVVMRLLRSQESFTMSWLNAVEAGDGRTSIWLHPDGDIRFHFAGSRTPTLDPDWIARLTESARSSRGLVVTNEDGSLARSAGNGYPRGRG